MFIDKARIFIKSGKGGRGSVSFLRSKFIPRGGPDGGNGGRGGDIIIQGNHGLNTLFQFRYQKNFKAEDGAAGEENNKSGKNGEHLTIRVPLGTILTFANGDKMEVLDENPIKILQGGKGGVGNGCLANSINQAPKHSIPPEEAEEMFLYLELKLIGDLGLIGMPNAGKSSFINSCTNAQSKIGDYAFTTLEPKLGILENETGSLNLIIVDIPGIIEGASEGKGLGLNFLSHIERCKGLLMLVDISDNPEHAIKILLQELKSYNIEKKIVLVLTKIELIKKKKRENLIYKLKDEFMFKDIFGISVHKKAGIEKLLKFIKNYNNIDI